MGGERGGWHRMTEGQRAEIRRLLDLGLSPTVIERRTGISRQAIRRLRDGANSAGAPGEEAPG